MCACPPSWSSSFLLDGLWYRVGHEKVVRLSFAFGYCIDFCIYVMLRTRATFLWPTMYVIWVSCLLKPFVKIQVWLWLKSGENKTLHEGLLTFISRRLRRAQNTGDVQWLRRLVAGLSSRRPGFNSMPVRVGIVADKLALGQVFLRVPLFPLCYSTDDLCSLFVCYQSCVIAAIGSIIK
jgi:hypothetical protein